jgi:hypothetical protein
MGAQFIKTPDGEDLAVLPRSEYEALIQALEDAEEDLADIAAYDAAKADTLGSEPLPVEVSQYVMKGNGLVKSLRLWRKLSQAAAGNCPRP